MPTPAIPPATSATAQTLLRFHGSNTIGGKLLPALATVFLQQQGYTNVHKENGVKEDESFIVGEHDGHSEQIENFFKEAALKSQGKTLASNAQRFEDSEKLSAAVTADPAGVEVWVK